MPSNFLKERLEAREREYLKENSPIKRGLILFPMIILALEEIWFFQERVKKRIHAYEGEVSGSKSSRLLAGQSPLFLEVEEMLASFTKAEEAIFFPSGYQANLALLSSLLLPQDLVLSDEFNHASIIDGIRLSKGEKKIFSHNNVRELEKLLETHKNEYENIFIVCESLYSMEGTLSPLREMANLASSYGAHLIVDESHSTGLFAPDGTGLVNELGIRDQIFCTLHTGGKALGVSGAWMSGGKNLKEYLANFSRGFIYSTAPSPLQLISPSGSPLSI